MQHGTSRNHRRIWAVGMLFATLGYVTWRAGWTLRGTSTWLSIPALAVELLGLVGTLVLLGALGSNSRDITTPETDASGERLDVVIRLDGHSVDQLRSTLAGVRAMTDAGDVTVVTREHGEEIAAAVGDTDVTVIVAPFDDATALRTARTRGTSAFVLLLDAGDVPTPSLWVALERRTAAAKVVVVQGALYSLASDSAEHDSNGTHELAFERMALLPRVGACGRAVVMGSGAIVRRSVLDAVPVPVPDGDRHTAELRWSIRLHGAGFALRATSLPVVSAGTLNTWNAVLAERRRQTHASLTVLRSADSPLWRRGLDVRTRISILSTMVRPLSGLRRAAFALIVLAAIITGTAPPERIRRFVQTGRWPCSDAHISTASSPGRCDPDSHRVRGCHRTSGFLANQPV